jgi:hypothetical protein
MPGSSQEVLRINQLEYLTKLKEKRPDLLKEDCKGNLIAKPEYRDLILNGSSMSSLLKDDYSERMQIEDARWADEYRNVLEPDAATSGYNIAAYYNPLFYFGYLVGVDDLRKNKNLLTHPFIDSRGIGYKVFFQLRDFQNDLTARAFQLFAHALSQSGFRGDLKVQLQLGNARFKFNNVVVHAATRCDSFLAEQVGLRFFCRKLAATSRGVDVDLDPSGEEPALDWSEFLCSRNFADLPLDVRNYVNYRDHNHSPIGP